MGDTPPYAALDTLPSAKPHTSPQSTCDSAPEMQNSGPLVSVVIPTRHRLDLLQRAINSVNNQHYANIDIIVVDNASDAPLCRTQLSSQRPLKVVRTETMKLLPSTRNFGAAHSKAPFISFLDDDDEILPCKLSSHMQAFSVDPSLDYVYGDTRQVSTNGDTIMMSSGPIDLVHFLHWRYIHTNALTLRRSVFDALQYSADMSTYEDIEFTARLMRAYKGHHIKQVHAVWNRDNRPDQMTRRNYRRAYENWGRLCDRFDDIISADKGLRRFYHRKMLALSVMFGDLRQAMISMRKII
ncbi:MAG: glycosyltransferase family A protein [Pseudomonadota bacterium]